VFTHSARRIGLDHRLNAGIFERAFGQIRLWAATIRLNDNKLTVLHSRIICPDEREGALLRTLRWTFHLADFGLILCCMADPNPLAGVVPRVVHPKNDGETTISQYLQRIEGEVALDGYVRAQTSAPEIVKRITELENCLQRVASAILASSDIDAHPELRAAAEEAKLVLKNQLEVDDSKHRFHSELGVFKDDLRIIKD